MALLMNHGVLGIVKCVFLA